METAGKLVDNEELRDALKENGIGRPSTRAAIIETLFRRRYIFRKRKAILPTETGVQLISLIREELLKSAELTGRWEKKLRQIEHHEYSAPQFVEELKQMVQDLVMEVLRDNTHRQVTSSPAEIEETPAKAPAKAGVKSGAKPKAKIIRAGSVCPKCGQGKVIKGRTAYGCSRWQEGCDWRKPFK